MLSMLPSNVPWHIYIYICEYSVCTENSRACASTVSVCAHHTQRWSQDHRNMYYVQKWLGNLEETCVELYCQSLTRVAID